MPYPTDTGLADEQARKRQLYEDALDRFAGFEPGESQLTDDQIMARRAARGQAATSGESGALQHQSPFPPFGSPPPHMMADPMSRMQWQAMMQNRQQTSQARQMRRAQRKAINNEGMLAHLRANDPLFEHVKRWIDAFVESLPGKLQRAVLEQVERTPGAFLEMYSELRQHLMEEFGMAGRVRKGAPGIYSVQGNPSLAPAARDPRQAVRQAVAGRMSPPQLESVGMIDERTPGVARAAERAALIKRVKAGGAREGDLLKYLELSGL